jgi:hypothetical protein
VLRTERYCVLFECGKNEGSYTNEIPREAQFKLVAADSNKIQTDGPESHNVLRPDMSTYIFYYFKKVRTECNLNTNCSSILTQFIGKKILKSVSCNS